MNLNIDQVQVAIFFGLVSLVGGMLSWGLNLKVRHDIMEHNEKTLKDIGEARDKTLKEISDLREKITTKIEKVEGGFATDRDKLNEKLERFERDFSADRVVSMINGKYVRTDLYQQYAAATTERLEGVRQLIELYMSKIEENLNRQIEDLKERIKL